MCKSPLFLDFQFRFLWLRKKKNVCLFNLVKRIKARAFFTQAPDSLSTFDQKPDFLVLSPYTGKFFSDKLSDKNNFKVKGVRGAVTLASLFTLNSLYYSATWC